MIESLNPKDVIVNITVDDVRLRLKLTINITLKHTTKSFF